MLECSLCGSKGPESEFVWNTRCRVCYNEVRRQRSKGTHSARARLKRYGLSDEEYRNMIEAQNNACALCGGVFSISNEGVVDHDHSTGKVRGLIHRYCNLGLGHFQDSPEMLEKALTYLEAHRA